jgi:hypothetical protein
VPGFVQPQIAGEELERPDRERSHHRMLAALNQPMKRVARRRGIRLVS